MHTAKKILGHLNELREAKDIEDPIRDTRLEDKPIKDDHLVPRNEIPIPELSLADYIEPEKEEEEQENPIRCGSTVGEKKKFSD